MFDRIAAIEASKQIKPENAIQPTSGAALFSDRVEAYIPPARGRQHALRIVRDMLAHRAEGRGTSLAAALRFGAITSRARSRKSK